MQITTEKMKHFLAAFAIVICCFTSCKKDDATEPETTPTNNGTPPNTSTVPSSFTQKVLIETFTGAGQGQCTDGFVAMSSIMASNGMKAIPVYIHYSDAMEMSQYTVLQNAYNNGVAPMFPSAMINRTPSLGNYMLNRTQWSNNFSVAKGKTSCCGLAITTSVSSGTASVTVKTGFCQTVSGNYKLIVYLVEDSITGTGSMYDQRNSYNNVNGHTYFGMGDPILNFRHNYVLRTVISAAAGDDITSATAQGSMDQKTYSFNTAGINTSNASIVAFVMSGTTNEVMNVQKVKLGSTAGWD